MITIMKVDIVVGMKRRMPRRKTDDDMVGKSFSHDWVRICLSGFRERA